MKKWVIKTESRPKRCEICHKGDEFNAINNFCLRCRNISFCFTQGNVLNPQNTESVVFNLTLLESKAKITIGLEDIVLGINIAGLSIGLLICFSIIFNLFIDISMFGIFIRFIGINSIFYSLDEYKIWLLIVAFGILYCSIFSSCYCYYLVQKRANNALTSENIYDESNDFSEV